MGSHIPYFRPIYTTLSFTVTLMDNKGAGIIATQDYVCSAGVKCLTAFFICETEYIKGPDGGVGSVQRVYCFPLESRSGAETPACAAYRALHEELHLRGVKEATISNPHLFAHLQLPSLHLYVAQQPGSARHAGGECGTYSRAAFQQRRAAITKARAAGEKKWEGVDIHCHLETYSFVHVAVSSLLVNAEGNIVPRDQNGVYLDLRLRKVCYNSLKAAGVQAALRSALANFYARHPHLKPGVGGQAGGGHHAGQAGHHALGHGHALAGWHAPPCPLNNDDDEMN